MKFSVIFAVLVCCLPRGEAQFPEECATNLCPENELCYNRYYSTVSDYVCQCDNDNVGYDCSVDVSASSQQTCYGSACTDGTFTSPNWPSNYANSDTRVYLIFVPLAIRLSFTFDPNFAVAFDDELYIGTGLTFNINSDLNAVSDPIKQVYFFSGNSAPDALKFDGTDSAWLFWRTNDVGASAGFSVTWEATLDTTPPVVYCPWDQYVEVGVGVTSSPIFYEEPTATDRGEVRILMQSHRPGDIFPSDQVTAIIYIFEDAAGNVAPACLFFLYVITDEDTAPPVVDCPDDFTEYATQGVTSAEVFYDEPTATDDGGPALLLAQSHVPGDTFPLGPTLVSYTFEDIAGNIAPECSFYVFVLDTLPDTIPPEVNCPADINQPVPFGMSFISVNFPNATATDNSGTASFLSVYPPFDFPFSLGTTNVTFSFIDPSDNIGTCMFAVTVSRDDTTPPVVTCPANITRSVLPGVTSLDMTFPNATATDDSGSSSLVSVNFPSGSSFSLGRTEVTFVFQDEAGNEGSCTFIITVVTSAIADTTPPVVTCPPNITRSVLPGVTSLQVTFPTATATDDSSSTSFVSVNFPSGSSFSPGQTAVTFVFQDEAGNEGSCTFVIVIFTSTLPDTTPPVVTCPPNITRSVLPGVTSLQVTFPTATAADDFSSTSFVSVNFPSGSSFSLGQTAVTFVFQDEAGNEGFCTFVIVIFTSTLPDTIPPIVTCPSNITRSVPSGEISLQVTFETATATDDSGSSSFVSVNFPSGSSFSLGQTAVTFVFQDKAGNEGSCTFVITIVTIDTIPPVVTCPANITQLVPQGISSQRVVFPAATATDNSGRVSLVSVDPPSGSLFPLGSTEVTVEFADPRGNVGNCTFFVTISPLGPTGCGNSSCANGATCVTVANGFLCECLPGFVGSQCEIDVNECSSLPCLNGGTCINGVNRFSCHCRQGYSGVNCGKVEICDLEGEWYNECNDRLTLSPTSTGLILGVYHTNTEINTGYRDSTVVMGYTSLKCPFSSFGFIVSWNNGESTGGWSGQCHLCDGQEILYTTWTTRLRVSTCAETRIATRVGQDKWTRYRQHQAPREA